MYAIKNNVYVGYANGRIVLSPGEHTEHLPIKYLSEGSSILLCDLINHHKETTAIKDLYNKGDLASLQQRLIEEVKPYLIETNQLESRVSFEKLLESKKRNMSHEYFRLDYPIKLVVIPTWKCNRSCTYCGVPKILPGAYEDMVKPQILLERILDAVDNGVQEVVYHGGEPLFFYEPIYEHIQLLISKKVNIKLSTKNNISKTIAHKLSEVGLSKIQLSVDTIDPVLCKQLYGDEQYALKMQNTILNLLSEGINPRVNIVLSRLNYRNIVELLTFLDLLHVSEVEISNYKCGIINNLDLSLSKEDCAWFHRAMVKNKSKWHFKELIIGKFLEQTTSAIQRSICESARLGLVILPDGSTCYCDFLCTSKEFCFENIKNMSVGQIWNSKELLMKAFPTKTMFASDSKCNTCKMFESCKNRGICYVSTGGKFDRDFKCEECLD